MEAILAIGGIWLFFFLVRIAFRSLGAATKATVDAASGKKNFAESFSQIPFWKAETKGFKKEEQILID